MGGGGWWCSCDGLPLRLFVSSNASGFPRRKSVPNHRSALSIVAVVTARSKRSSHQIVQTKSLTTFCIPRQNDFTESTTENMDHHHRPNTALFDVYLRLRPSSATDRPRFLDVEHTAVERDDISHDHTRAPPTHIMIRPPASDNNNRKRAVEKFAFTRVFEEHAGQRELFEKTGAVQLVEGVLGQRGREGRDGLVATLGVTGSGKVCLIHNLPPPTRG